jgi:hypothetical protein
MKIYDIPVFASSLEELPLVLKHLDRKYGLHDINDAKKENGEYALRFILKHLSLHRESTCLDIAKAEHQRTPEDQKKQRTLKSITNNVRIFIKNNLISSQLVYKGEPKIIANKHIETFSLSPIGILYAIHLFGKVRETEDGLGTSFIISDMDKKFIRKLGEEYSQTFPKIFGKLKIFEKVLGKDFESVLINPLIEIIAPRRDEVYEDKGLLRDYVLTHFTFVNPSKIKTVHGLITEQISLIFYIYLKESIYHFLREIQDSMFFKLSAMSDDQRNEYFKNNYTKEHLYYLRMSKQKWLQIMNEDKELKKWYKNFLIEAAKSKEREYAITLACKRDELSEKFKF